MASLLNNIPFRAQTTVGKGKRSLPGILHVLSRDSPEAPGVVRFDTLRDARMQCLD